jgi:outer membrane lipoprotein SlyB
MTVRGVGAALVLTAALSSGASAAPNVGAEHVRCRTCGTVVDVDPIYGRERSVGSGAVIGALVGGAVGNRIGSGRTAATVTGAAAGVAMGYNAADGRAIAGYSIIVRMDDGAVRTLRAPDDHDLDRGDRVRVRDGRVQRL